MHIITMQAKFKCCLFILLLALLQNVIAYEQSSPCPVLTDDDVLTVINEGRISTDGITLADRLGFPPDEIIKREPTANPYDTYYQMSALKDINYITYLIFIGDILGKDYDEARTRAKKILLGTNLIFSGEYDSTLQTCTYKDLEASPTIPGYPFKSRLEFISLLTIVPINKLPSLMWKTIPKVY